MLSIQDILGLENLPKTKQGVIKWLRSNCVPCTTVRQHLAFSILDLPAPVQLAYRLRLAEEAGLAFGEQNDAAHVELQTKPIGVQHAAHARAEILTFVHRHQAAGLSWPQIAAQFKAAGFGDGPSYKTVKRWFEMVADVAPADWAPALAPDYVGRNTKAPITEAAWEEYCAKVATSGRNGTGVNFKRLWKQVKATADKSGWAWPSYETVQREFRRLPVEQQRVLRDGAEAAAKSITMRLPRSLEGLRAMEQVELDGREFKVKVRFENGEIGCPHVIVYADRASCKIVGWAISDSENEDVTAEATNRMCDTHGIPDRVVTDNGGAFNGRRMAGGLKPLIRRKETKKPDWDVPGLFKIYGMDLHNCAPRKGWAKIVESVYSVLRHLDNDPVFHRAQRSGPNDAPNENAEPVDISLFRKAVDQEIENFNADRTTRAMGVKKGENRNEAFVRLSEGRIARTVTPLQRREARVKYRRVMVQQDGRIKFEGGLWGDESTQSKMLQHAGTWVIAGFDPKDYSASAIVRGWEDPKIKGRLLFDALPNFEPARHNDEASRRRAVTEDRRTKKLVQKFVRPDLDERVAGWRSDLMGEAGVSAPPVAPKVVQIDTRGPFSPAAALYQTTGPSQAAQIRAVLMDEENNRNRAISGGNR